MKAIRTILACIRKADNKYNLINHGDKIVVGLSGGKDSMCLLYALTLYQKFSHTDFIIQPVTLDLGFPNFDPSSLEEYCKSLGLNLIVHDSKEVYKILLANKDENKHLPCSICSKMKKASINKVANELGFNKVAFAHHSDDAIETLLLNEIYGARVATFSPKMHLEKTNITFIRPLIIAKEKDIIKLVKEENIPVIKSNCPADKLTKREDIKKFTLDLYKRFPEARENFLTMLDNYKKEDLWGKELYYQINSSGLTLKPVISKEDLFNVIKIRYEVFVKGFNIPYNDEMDKTELEANTFLIYQNNIPIGTIRYRIFDDGIKIERFAILEQYRNNHYGKFTMLFLIEMLGKEYNPCRIYLNAMTYLKEYYQSIGFTSIGEEFLEENIPHIKMYIDYK